MKKSSFNINYIPNFLIGIAILLIVGFVIRVGADYYQYTTYLNSAPFYVYILFRSATYLVPSTILFIVARIVRKKNTNKK